MWTVNPCEVTVHAQKKKKGGRSKTRRANGHRVFWLNIAKFEVNWCYRYCYNLFSNMRKESELRQYHCRNSTKVGKRKIKSRREKFLIFGNGIAAIPSAHTCCSGGCSKCECAQGKPNDVEIFFFFWQLWQCHCRKWEEKNSDCQNHMWGIKKKKCYVYNIFTIFSQQITCD